MSNEVPYKHHTLLYKLVKNAMIGVIEAGAPDGLAKPAESVAEEGLDWLDTKIHEHRIADKEAAIKAKVRMQDARYPV